MRNDSEDTEPAGAGLSEKQLVLLGLLAEEPIHAYGLEEKIRERTMDQWTEIGFSSIYRVLGQLEARELIDTELRHEGQGATRKVHALTSAGRQALVTGLLERVTAVRPLKNPFQVALAYLVHAPYADAVAGLRSRREEVGEVSQVLEGIAAHHRSGPFPDEAPARTRRRQTSVHLLFEHMRYHLEAEQAFIEAALGYLAEQGDAAFTGAEERS